MVIKKKLFLPQYLEKLPNFHIQQDILLMYHRCSISWYERNNCWLIFSMFCESESYMVT